MEDGSLGAKARALVEEGRGEQVGGIAFLPLLTLDSEARMGLDAEGRFAIADADGAHLHIYTDAEAHRFHEALEWKRNAFDDALEEGACSLGLPPEEVSLAFPVVGIIRAVLAKDMHYTTRLALHWLRPSELRDAREDIQRVAQDRFMPAALRELAARLLVPV